MDLYYEDKVTGAYDVASTQAGAFGGSMLRDYARLEGEALTRKLGQRAKLAPWLEFEWVDAELPHHEAVGQVVLHAVSETNRRLQWDASESVLVSVLTTEADTREYGGYCVDKVPYDKICLPRSACSHPERLAHVVAHEAAHVVVLNTAQKVAPQWLDEGIACLMEGRDAATASARLTSHDAWRAAFQMGGAFEVDRRDPTETPGVTAAYDEATVLASYLHSLKGDEGLVELLKGMAPKFNLGFVFKRLARMDPVDMALRQVYGFGQRELFAKVRGGPR